MCSIIWNIERSVFQCEKKIDRLPTGRFLQLQEFCLGPWLKKWSLWFWGDKGRWVWLSREIIDNRFFLEIRTIWTLMQRKKTSIFHFKTPLQGLFLLDWFLVGWNPNRSGWGRKVWTKNKKSIFLEISNCQDTDTRNTKRQFSHRRNLYSQNNFDAHPDGTDKACSFGDKWVWISRKNIINVFSGIFRLSHNWCRGEKQWIFSWRLVYRCWFFDWVFDGGNRTGSGWVLKVWISSGIKITGIFWNIWTVTNPTHGSKWKDI